MTHPVFVALILLNIILLVVSLCVTDSELLNSVCINRSVWTPTLSLLSSTDKDLLYHDMSACPHNSTVYGRDSVCDRQRDPLSKTTPTHHHQHHASILCICLHQQATVHKLLRP